MMLDPAAFNSFLPMMGQRTSWRRGYACPCVDIYTGQPIQACPDCAGRGRVWDVAVDSGRVGIVGRDLMKKWAEMGGYAAGDVLLSIQGSSPLYAIGPFDRVTLKDRSEPFSDAIVHAVNSRLRWPVLSIDRVMWKDAAGANVIGPLPVIAADGLSLSWAAGGPPMDATISITGRRAQEFYVYQEQPFDRPLHGGAKLPRRIVLRRFELFGTG